MNTHYDNINQMFLIGIKNKKVINNVLYLIEKYSIGGVVIYKNNYDNYDEMLNLINRLKRANKNNKYPLFIAIDQENGRVNRMPKEFKVIKNAAALANADDNTIKDAGIVTSQMLINTGINMNFAPVVDLKKWDNTHAIGNRAFSSDPKKVSHIANIIAKEHQNNNVIPVIKHFPGHGSIKMDSHLFLPIINNYDDILASDIIPFEDLIKKQIDAIMVGHIMIKKKTGLYPASLSRKFIQNELRNKYNYSGIIMTDELLMNSIYLLYGTSRAIKKAIYAGNDILCCKYFNNIEKTIIKMNKLFKNNNQILDSLNRIANIKEKYYINDEEINKTLNIKKINEQIKVINDTVENVNE